MTQRIAAWDRPTRGAKSLALVLLASTIVAASGCTVDRLAKYLEQASPEIIAIREVPRNPLAEPLKLFSKEGPQPLPSTVQLLQRHGLEGTYRSQPRQAIEKLQEAMATAPAADTVYAIAELTYIQGAKAAREGNDSEALDMYGAAVGHAYFYLFDRQLDPTRNPYNPEFQRAADLYNASLEGTLRIVRSQGEFLPGRTYRVKAGSREFDVAVKVKGRWRDEDIERFEFASDYEVKGLRQHYTTQGLGVPLVAIRRKASGADPADRFYPQGLAFPVTAFLHVTPHTRCPKPGCTAHYCELELRDPLETTDILVNGRPTPMESDLTTPLAYFLNAPLLRANLIGTFGLLDADAGQQFKGIYMMEPYDPSKVPVVLVHGLWSSPVTWMEMFNDLRSDPEIRKHCQFWFFLYPTGQPFWISAKQFRDELASVRQTIDPQRQCDALDQMVLIGHSMGGLVSMMQTLESGDDFLRIITDRPFEELKADEATRQALASTLFFQPNPSIRQVITIASPHQGSHFANAATRYVGRSLINLPKMLVMTSQTLVKDNPGYFRDTDLLTITTSIDSLAPDSPIFPVMLKAQKSPWTRYHNIVGKIDNQSLAGLISPNSDGVVPLASAQRSDFHSEVLVEADHGKVHSHPDAILQVRHILKGHVGEVCAARAAPPHRAAQVGYQAPRRDPPPSLLPPQRPADAGSWHPPIAPAAFPSGEAMRPVSEAYSLAG